MFEEYKFKYKFRSYQQKALDEVHKYMEDDKLHIVAAPGAGKTILALQLMIEMGNATLICVPTITLREQWIERFCTDFTDNKDAKNIISTDLTNPNVITVCTYQAIYSTYRNKDKVTSKENEKFDETIDDKDEEYENNEVVNCKYEDVIKSLKKNKISTVILDEAHHLKTAWWDSLVDMIERLGKVKTISLTATPPYDTKNAEWKKYIELCGNIDTEVTVPELVRNRDLCPHQDYILFNYPNEEQIKEMEQYSKKAKEIYENLCDNEHFITAVSLHPGIIEVKDRIDYFLERFDYYISILSFLKYKRVNIPDSNLEKYIKKLPAFNLTQMEILLTNALFGDKSSYKSYDSLFKEIKRELNQIGAIEDSKVSLTYNKNIKKLISQNIGKLNSINEIIYNEFESLKNEMKLAIITDYIKEEVYEVDDETEINTMGAIPIFKNILRDNKINNINLAILTGKMVIIPTSLKGDFVRICEERRIDRNSIRISELKYNFNYSKIVLSGNSRKEIVGIITQLFESSNINVLIGTNALIGEGWDAPFINTLIMANFAGTYVTSNQIRGRVIRINKKDKDKVSNIWHLVCVEKSGENYLLGNDYETLKRKFEAFEGIYINENKIDRGIERISLDSYNINDKKVNEFNNIMIEKALNRQETKNKWEQSVKNYIPTKKEKIILEEYTPYVRKYKAEVTKSKVQKLIILGIALAILRNSDIFLSGVAIGLIFVNIYQLIYRTSIISFSKGIGNALKKTLIEINKIQNTGNLKLLKENNQMKFYLNGVSTKDNSIFNDSLKEMLSDIENPRYIFKINKAYFQVPSIIAKNKEWTNLFRKNLEGKFGKIHIIYTRNEIGKQELLKTKLDHML